jgi:predicted GNAT family N-acyltransferase
MEKGEVKIRLIRNDSEWKETHKIRSSVFGKEQKIPPILIFDGLDKKAKNFLAFYQNKPVGTARIITKGKKARLGRLAVLKKYREKNIGSAIIKYIIAYCKRYGFKEIYFHSQLYIKDFYEKLGFKIRGKPFFEAKIKHVGMYLKLK